MAVTGAITPGTSTAGNYTVTYTIAAAGGCAVVTATANVTVTALPVATITYAGSPFCKTLGAGQAVTQTGTAGGAYTSAPAGLTLDAATGAINPSTSTAGVYTVTYTIAAAGGCAVVTTTAGVTITTLPAATISYGGSPFCKTLGAGQAVTRTGTAGGAYSAAPAGLTIDAVTGAINPSSSTAGAYTVTYTIAAAGGCAVVTATTPVTITALPTAAISYTGSPWCSTAGVQNVTLVGTAGGAYTAAPAGLTIDAATGAITPGTSTAGAYTVTYTIAAAGGCAVVTATANVNVTALPAATITYAGSPFCKTLGAGQAVTRTGTAGGSYSAAPAGLTINAVTGAINPSTSTAGAYTVTYTIAAAGGCAVVTATTPVTITALPTATISYTGSPWCSTAGVQNVTLTGTAGGTYTAAPAGLTIDAATGAITPGTSTAGAYTVTYTIAAAGGCAVVTATANVSITALPVATITYAGSPFCKTLGAGQAVTRTGTAGGTYSALPAGLTIDAVTGAVNPGTSTAGAYTVTYTIAAAGGCAVVTTTTPVTITALPIATITYAGSPFCKTLGAGQPVTQTGTAGGAYSAAPAGLTIDAVTGAINPGTSTAGIYTVTYTIAAAGGCAVVTATTSVTITTLPAATISYVGSPFCKTLGAGQAVTLTGTAGGTYTAAPAGLTIDAVTGAINPSTSTAGVYTVTYTIAAAGGCAIVTATTPVTITALPVAAINYAGSPFCKTLGAGQPVTQTGTAGGAYSAAPAGLTIDAVTGAINPCYQYSRNIYSNLYNSGSRRLCSCHSNYLCDHYYFTDSFYLVYRFTHGAAPQDYRMSHLLEQQVVFTVQPRPG